MKRKFKVGDKVKSLVNRGSLKKGNIYTVYETFNDDWDDFVYVEKNGHKFHGGWLSSRFEHVRKRGLL